MYRVGGWRKLAINERFYGEPLYRTIIVVTEAVIVARKQIARQSVVCDLHCQLTVHTTHRHTVSDTQRHTVSDTHRHMVSDTQRERYISADYQIFTNRSVSLQCIFLTRNPIVKVR